MVRMLSLALAWVFASGMMFASTVHAQVVNGDNASTRAVVRDAAHADDSLSQAIEALSAANLQRYMDVVREARAAGKALPTAVTVDFDDETAPCSFFETVPLSRIHQGAFFWAPEQRGGAILDGCSNFGVSPRSGSNFLAFNRDSAYADGRTPSLPEMIAFGRPVLSVELALSSGFSAPQSIVLAAYSSGVIVDMQAVRTTNDWTLHLLTSADGRPIDAVVIVGRALTLVVDDVHAE